jgi:hypothetical protein
MIICIKIIILHLKIFPAIVKNNEQMTRLSNRELFQANILGLIPGPGESDETFQKRVQYNLSLVENLKDALPFAERNLAAEELKLKGEKSVEALFDIKPEWIPIYQTNYKLPPWHAACAWIFQIDTNSPIAAFIQMRKKSWIDPVEAIGHEMCHAARMSFENERFEELFAYQTSKSSLRRFFGPLIEKPFEVNLFVIFILVMLVLDFFAIKSPNLHPFILYSKLLIVIPLSFALIRLLTKQFVFKKAKNNLSKISNLPMALLFRMTDFEIKKAAGESPQETVNRILVEEKRSPRGRVLAHYLSTLEYENPIPKSPFLLQEALDPQ